MFKRYIINLMLSVLPPTRCFGIKRSIVKWGGYIVGDGVCINGFTQLFGKGEISIGSNTWVGLKNSFYCTEKAVIKIGKNCDIGPDVAFVTGSHEIGGPNRRAGMGIGGDIMIEDGCWIGARVTILGNVTISKGSIIAAGSVVRESALGNSLYAGVPAVLKRDLFDSYE